MYPFYFLYLGLLVVYSNRFLMKRRKKELGIYMLLGMDKGKISRILIIETLLIGIFSLGIGLAVGIFASQGLSAITAGIFEMDLSSFQFTFSLSAFYKTLLYFGIIFLIVMIFNTISISKYKLITLLQASRKNESFKVRNIWISIIAFIVSIACFCRCILFGFNKRLGKRRNAFNLYYSRLRRYSAVFSSLFQVFCCESSKQIKTLLQRSEYVYFQTNHQIYLPK